jgi:hypothetical protein
MVLLMVTERKCWRLNTLRKLNTFGGPRLRPKSRSQQNMLGIQLHHALWASIRDGFLPETLLTSEPAYLLPFRFPLTDTTFFYI